MGKTYTRPKAVKSKSTGIKPFLEKPSVGFSEMMRRITQTAVDWKVKEKHSEKIKPYLVDPDASYPMMDDLWPTPYPFEFPGMDAGDWTDVYPGEVIPEISGCAISCSHPSRTCDGPVKCYYMRAPIDEKPNVDAWKIIPHISYGSGAIASWRATYLWPIDGDIVWFPNKGLFGEIWIYPPEGDWSNLYDETSPSAETFIVLKLQFTQKDGHTCTDLVSVACDECATAAAIAFDDDSTADTIAPGGDVTVYVTGGIGPYTWSTTSLGYSFASNVTDEPYNTLSCVEGDCDVDFDPYCAFTITDKCDTQDSSQIRNTAGSTWTEIDNCVVAAGGQEAIGYSGKYKYIENYCTVCPGDTCPEECAACAANSCGLGSYSSAMEDNPFCPGETTKCCLLSWYQYEWGC